MADFQIITTKDTKLHEGNLESKTFVILRDLRGDDFLVLPVACCDKGVTPQSRSGLRLWGSSRPPSVQALRPRVWSSRGPRANPKPRPRPDGIFHGSRCAALRPATNG